MKLILFALLLLYLSNNLTRELDYGNTDKLSRSRVHKSSSQAEGLAVYCFYSLCPEEIPFYSQFGRGTGPISLLFESRGTTF